MIKRLFLDIETCPNVCFVWRTGYKISVDAKSILFPARIITAAWKWQGGKKTEAIEWTPGKQFQESDEQLINAIVPVMAQADEIVAHYGDGFDIPWIRGRALKHGVICPILKTVDTKAWSSKLFYLPSNKLDFLAEYLGIGKKIRTDYELWKDVAFRQDIVALKKMVMYNIHDVELLEPVYHKLSDYGPVKTHVGVLEGGEKWSCARCGSEKVRRMRPQVSAKGSIQHQMQCQSCGKYYMISNKAHEDFIAERGK
jgi:hypothetical protein